MSDKPKEQLKPKLKLPITQDQRTQIFTNLLNMGIRMGQTPQNGNDLVKVSEIALQLGSSLNTIMDALTRKK